MPDYKEMYFKMFRAAEKATNLLIEAQQECEALYLEEEKPVLTLRSQAEEKEGSGHP